MEDLVDELTLGNVSQVKTVLASVVMALAFFQVFLMAVTYGKLRLPFLKGKAASFAHRGIGDSIALLIVLVAWMCLSYFGVQDGIEYARDGETTRGMIHVIAGFGVLGVLALKIIVIRWWHSMGRFLPLLGLTVFTLLLVIWVSSAGNYLVGG